MRILIADDEPSIRDLYRQILRSAGYQTTLVCNGVEASELLSGYGYDLLITDNIMPELSGIELLKKLRNERIYISTIMISGNMPFDDPDFSEYVTADRFLAKPFTAKELLDKVAFVLRYAHAQSPKSMISRSEAQEVGNGSNQPYGPTDVEIQKLAYHLYLSSGCTPGRDGENWLTARDILRHHETLTRAQQKNLELFLPSISR